MNIDTAYSDRQDLINNLSGGVQPPIRVSDDDGGGVATQSLPAQSLPDTWEAIAAQLDHWADMDKQYWQQRKEKAYAAWMERTYGV